MTIGTIKASDTIQSKEILENIKTIDTTAVSDYTDNYTPSYNAVDYQIKDTHITSYPSYPKCNSNIDVSWKYHPCVIGDKLYSSIDLGMSTLITPQVIGETIQWVTD